MWSYKIPMALLFLLSNFVSNREAAGDKVSFEVTLSSPPPMYDELMPGISAYMDSNDYTTYYVAIADTGNNYYKLHSQMVALNKKLNISIDTLGRGYNPLKDLICLPDNAEDEIYAGDYFPRRTDGEFLSLEYLVLYKNTAGENTMALVAGIYEKAHSADSMVKLLKPHAKKAFATPAELYQGCLH